MPNEDNLPGRVSELEQKNASTWALLSRIFDIDPKSVDQVEVLVRIREALLYAKEMGGRRVETERLLQFVRQLEAAQGPSFGELLGTLRDIHVMKDPSYDEVLSFTKRAMQADQNRVKNVNSALRLILATVVGGVIVGVILWKITGHP